jgi:hypothetical protein
MRVPVAIVLLFALAALIGNRPTATPPSSNVSTVRDEKPKPKEPDYDYYIERAAVWKSYDAMEQGKDLIRLGVNKKNPYALMKLANCVVSKRAKIEIVYSTFSMWHPSQTQYVVLEGESAGCQGWVDHDDMIKVERVEEKKANFDMDHPRSSLRYRPLTPTESDR